MLKREIDLLQLFLLSPRHHLPPFFFQRAGQVYPYVVSSLCQHVVTLSSCQICERAACPLAVIVLASAASTDASHDIPAVRRPDA